MDSLNMKVSFFQPILTAYRKPFLSSLAEIPGTQITLFSGVASSDYGVDSSARLNLGFNWKVDDRNLMRQASVASFKWCKSSVVENDVIVHFADFKYPSLYYCMFFSKFFNKRFFLHGQGGYKRKGLIHKIVYNMSLFCSDGYVCYSNFSEECLKKITFKFLHNKISVVNNSLYLPANKVASGGSDLLYIGRLRSGCGIDLLLEAAKLASLNVRVIGGGDDKYLQQLQQKFSNMIYFGSVYENEKQFAVAQGCFAGAYGGDAGLSVVHYMSYGLPVIVHSDLYKHMGPEPSFVVDGENGLTFTRGDVQSLASVLMKLKDDAKLQSKLSAGAIETFNRLNNPPMHEKFAKILGLI